MAQLGEFKMRILGMAALLVFVGAPVHALTFASPIPDEQYALGFSGPVQSEPVVTSAGPAIPDFLLSTDLVNDFLAASVDPASDADVIFSLSECFMWAGTTGCQSSVPLGVGPYTGVTTWTVTEIRVPVPENGLAFFIGGMGNGDTLVPPGNPPAPDYALGSVSVLTGGGVFAGEILPELDEMLLTFGGGIDYVYYGTVISQVGDSLTFGYTVDSQLAGGTPIFFSNAAQNVGPEPGTALLVAAGLALMAIRRGGRTAAEPSRYRS